MNTPRFGWLGVSRVSCLGAEGPGDVRRTGACPGGRGPSLNVNPDGLGVKPAPRSVAFAGGFKLPATGEKHLRQVVPPALRWPCPADHLAVQGKSPERPAPSREESLKGGRCGWKALCWWVDW